MDIVIMIAQLLLGISILVGLHELGHLIAAKAFGMRVEKYSIGFPPKIIGFKKGETEYSLGAIPLGGFVKISGMVDESLDTKSLHEAPQSWEFRSKPAWQRLIVMLGGIIVNVITGIIIFISLLFIFGETYISSKEGNKYGVVPNELGKKIGIQEGDKIVKINGKDYTNFAEIWSPDVLLNSNSSLTIERKGEISTIAIPEKLINEFSDKKTGGPFVDPISEFKVGKVIKKTGAEKAGLNKGDKIVEVNAVPIHFFHEFQHVLQANKNKDLPIVIEREGIRLTLQAHINENGELGFEVERKIDLSTTHYSLLQAIPKGTAMAFTIIWVNAKGLAKVITGKVSPTKSLSGPIGIAQIFGGQWNWQNFWRITGLLSMVLAFMNFLPIPALDGGHVMFLTYEIISGRKPSDKFLEIATKIGMVILIGLMLFAIFNDILKSFF